MIENIWRVRQWNGAAGQTACLLVVAETARAALDRALNEEGFAHDRGFEVTPYGRLSGRLVTVARPDESVDG